MVDIENYKVDLDQFFKLVLKAEKSEKRETEITDGFDVLEENSSLVPVSKVVREVKTKGDSYSDSLRFDLLKTLLLEIVETENNDFTDGTRVCINTLVDYNVLVPVEQ